MLRFGWITLVGLVGAVAFAWGCKDEGQPKSPPADRASEPAAATPAQPIVPQVQMIDWCREHGVPESICTRCNESLIAQYKEKGDWCNEHGLPESQCFVCHPELEAQFAAQYKAKYGKEPPATQPET